MENILQLPESTLVGKVVPKNAFWKRADGRQGMLKDYLTREVESIVLLYKLHPSTLNVEAGQEVGEIDVFNIRMKGDVGIDLSMLVEMDRMLPRHTMFVVEYGNMMDVVMHHKECVEVRGEKQWRCGKPVTRHSERSEESRHCEERSDVATSLRIEGQNMDAIYVSLLEQMSGMTLNSIEDYKVQTDENERREKIMKQIETLEKKARKETQPRKKFELVKMINELKRQL